MGMCPDDGTAGRDGLGRPFRACQRLRFECSYEAMPRFAQLFLLWMFMMARAAVAGELEFSFEFEAGAEIPEPGLQETTFTEAPAWSLEGRQLFGTGPDWLPGAGERERLLNFVFEVNYFVYRYAGGETADDLFEQHFTVVHEARSRGMDMLSRNVLERFWSTDQLRRGRLMIYPLEGGVAGTPLDVNVAALVRRSYWEDVSVYHTEWGSGRQLALLLVVPETGEFLRPRHSSDLAASLIAATTIGSMSWLEELLAMVGSLSRQERNRVMDHAVRVGHSEQLRRLLAAGLDLPSRGSMPPLMQAARTGRDEVVELLLDGASPAAVDLAMSWAVDLGHDAIALRLLRAGADFNKPGARNNLPITAAFINDRGALFAELIERGARFNWDSPHLPLGMMRRIHARETRIIEVLLANGFPVDAEVNGITPLMAAVRQRYPEACELFLQHGADPDFRDPDGATPLLVAAGLGDATLVQLLLAHGAHADSFSPTGLTPLFMAANQGHAEMVELLAAHGAAIDATDRLGLPAIGHSLLLGHREVSKRLIAHGARIPTDHLMAEQMLESALRDDLPELLERAIADGISADRQVHNRWSFAEAAALYDSPASLAWLGEAHGLEPAPDLFLPPRELREVPRIFAAGEVIDPRRGAEVSRAEVRVRVIVDEAGRPVFPKVVRSPDPDLIAAALNVVESMRFSTPVSEAGPVCTLIVVPVVFGERVREIYTREQVDTLPELRRPLQVRFRPGTIGIHGNVQASYLVNEEGEVEDITILNTNNPEWIRAVTEALKQASYRPAMRDGRPVAMRIMLTLTQ
ncbi:MAG: hypothetical protein EA425_06445 [Puniceicoccaceae bacterium]|nr:MAG: hypothetical protein EA425_06445 [Puniceicoccaceae bacterium]